MALRRGFSSLRTSGQRRKTSWSLGPQSGADGAPQSLVVSSSVLMTGGAAVVEDEVTLVRIRGDLNLLCRLSNAGAEGFTGAFGIGLANTAAFVAGVASLPTPIDEESWDGWIYHRYFSLISGGPLAAATAATQENQVNSRSAAMHIEVDSKAMRKASGDQTFFAVLQGIEIGSAAQMTVAFNSRMLFKLP